MTVGFAPAFGLAWLNERTRARPVSLLIGDTRTGFANYSEDDRQAAMGAFGDRIRISPYGDGAGVSLYGDRSGMLGSWKQ